MRGHKRELSPGRWRLYVYLGRDGAGKPRYKTQVVRGGKREAERQLAALVTSVSQGGRGAGLEGASLTVGEYLERWLVDYQQGRTGAKTFEDEASKTRGSLIPALGTVKLAKLSPLMITVCYADLLRSGRRDGKGGLSPQTVKHLHRILSKALALAVRWELITKNPALEVEPPRVAPVPVRLLTLPETGTLLAALAGTSLYLPVLMALSLGMRRGEILALLWADVDLVARELTVSWTLEETKGSLLRKAPKTKKSRRTLPLPLVLVEALLAQREWQAGWKKGLGNGYHDLGVVNCREDGRVWSPDYFSQVFALRVRAAGLAGLRFHDLRHNHATQLLVEKIHPKVVSERLGHSHIGITLATYSHVVPHLQAEASDAIEGHLRRVLEGETLCPSCGASKCRCST